MGWASKYITQLESGDTVQCRPRGNSMVGKISSGQLCTIIPISNQNIEKGDIVLCKVKGKEYLHSVTAIQGSRYQIGNNKGYINGWVSINQIFGKCIKVE